MRLPYSKDVTQNIKQNQSEKMNLYLISNPKIYA